MFKKAIQLISIYTNKYNSYKEKTLYKNDKTSNYNITDHKIYIQYYV